MTQFGPKKAAQEKLKEYFFGDPEGHRNIPRASSELRKPRDGFLVKAGHARDGGDRTAMSGTE